MHGFTRGLERRLKALEQRLGAATAPETDGERARRLELVRAAHLDLVPADLQESERVTFEKIKATVYIAREIRDGDDDGDDHRGLDAYLDENGDDPHRDLDDLDEPVWVP